LTVEQLDRLYRFRESKKWVNSVRQFQEVTGVSDQWLDSIGPYFKFPAWVNNSTTTKSKFKRQAETPINFNLATADQLKRVYGIGPATAKRILDERQKIGEFRDFIQISQIYGLQDSTLARVKKKFYLPEQNYPKISINQATREELLSIPYFNDYLVEKLIDQRTLRGGFDSWEDVVKTSRFPEEKLAMIQLYLAL
jgi:DNA uptake protein ComE-like DNA-binding protein